MHLTRSRRLQWILAFASSVILGCQLIALKAHAAGGKADRLAVIIANSSYTNIGALRNPVQDAELVSEAFRRVGFQVEVHDNLNESQFRKLARDLAKSTQRFDVTVVYYAGHGVQIDGVNYLLPIDLPPPESEDDVRLAGISADDVLSVIKSPYKVVVLDACRDNPVVSRGISRGRSISLKRGLAPPTAPEMSEGGIFIAYSTQADAVAVDGDGQYSPFANSFSAHVGNPGSIDDMFALVTRDVLKATNGLQRPFKYASLDSIFCLTSDCSGEGPATAATQSSPPTQSPATTSVRTRDGSTLLDQVRSLDALPPGSPESTTLTNQLRKRRLADFADVVVYGSGGPEGDVRTYGFLPSTVTFGADSVTVDMQWGQEVNGKMNWSPVKSQLLLNCRERTIETLSQSQDEQVLIYAEAERAAHRVTPQPSSLYESLQTNLCPGVEATTPIPHSDEVSWRPIGTFGKGNSAWLADGYFRTDRTNRDVRYAVTRSKFSVNDPTVREGKSDVTLVALDCKGRLFSFPTQYTLYLGTVLTAYANSPKWLPIESGSVMSNALVLACESR